MINKEAQTGGGLFLFTNYHLIFVARNAQKYVPLKLLSQKIYLFWITAEFLKEFSSVCTLCIALGEVSRSFQRNLNTKFSHQMSLVCFKYFVLFTLFISIEKVIKHLNWNLKYKKDNLVKL